MEKIIAQRMRAHAGCERDSQNSRQQTAFQLRRGYLVHVYKTYQFENRRAKRRIAFALARRNRVPVRDTQGERRIKNGTI